MNLRTFFNLLVEALIHSPSFQMPAEYVCINTAKWNEQANQDDAVSLFNFNERRRHNGAPIVVYQGSSLSSLSPYLVKSLGSCLIDIIHC